MALDISGISDRKELARAITGKSDDDINRSLAGRSATVVSGVAEGMKKHFVPEKAAKQSAVIQYDVDTPDGLQTFQVNVAEGKCDVRPGTPLPPRVTLNVSLPNFLRLASGKLGGFQAILTGRLGVSGDVLLARKLEGWFRG